MDCIDELLNKAKQHQNDHESLRKELAVNGQHPRFAVLCCSDSRVIPEEIFGCTIGELFVIRTAGNTLGPNELYSFQYAHHHLGIDTFLVLGHTHCGAIASTLAGENCPIFSRIRTHIKETHDPKQASIRNTIGVSKKLAMLFKTVQVVPLLYDLDLGEVIRL